MHSIHGKIQTVPWECIMRDSPCDECSDRTSSADKLTNSWVVHVAARHSASVDQRHSPGTEMQWTATERSASLRDLSNDFKRSELPRRRVLHVLVFSTAQLHLRSSGMSGDVAGLRSYGSHPATDSALGTMTRIPSWRTASPLSPKNASSRVLVRSRDKGMTPVWFPVAT